VLAAPVRPSEPEQVLVMSGRNDNWSGCVILGCLIWLFVVVPMSALAIGLIAILTR
jgi:hypothetical protein